MAKNDTMLPIDPRTALTLGQVGTTVLGTPGHVVSAGMEMVGTSWDIDSMTQEAKSLDVSGKAFKDYVRSLSDLYEERLVNFSVGIAGSAAATGIVALAFGPPGWIAGLAAAAGGGILASLGKEHFFPSQNRLYMDFAKQLQVQGQQGTLPPEAAFVALTMNMPDPVAIKSVIKSFPKDARIRNVNDMVKALGSEEGMMYLRNAMVENDFAVRAATGAITGMPGITISEEFANTVNDPRGLMAGVELLSDRKTTQVGTLLNMANMQRMQAAAEQQNVQLAGNPNQHLPSKTQSRDLSA